MNDVILVRIAAAFFGFLSMWLLVNKKELKEQVEEQGKIITEDKKYIEKCNAMISDLELKNEELTRQVEDFEILKEGTPLNESERLLMEMQIMTRRIIEDL